MQRAARLLMLLALVALGASRGSAQVGRSLGVLDPNVADGRDLLVVPGLTPELVKAILEARPFFNMTEFDQFLARNLDRDQRAALYQRLFLPINLNATTDDELRLVPGMGAHMLLEFRESRPFGSLNAFSQEVGKYLPPKDVAQLSQYFFVPLDVNTATDLDLLTIPGMTPKLLAAIKHQRPYSGPAAFLKVIRKNLSAKQATRFAAFIRTPLS